MLSSTRMRPWWNTVTVRATQGVKGADVSASPVVLRSVMVLR